MPKAFVFTPTIANVKLKTLAERIADLKFAPNEEISVLDFSERLSAAIQGVLDEIEGVGDHLKIAYFEKPPRPRTTGAHRFTFEKPPSPDAGGQGRVGFEKPPGGASVRCPLNDRRCKYYR